MFLRTIACYDLKMKYKKGLVSTFTYIVCNLYVHVVFSSMFFQVMHIRMFIDHTYIHHSVLYLYAMIAFRSKYII